MKERLRNNNIRTSLLTLLFLFFSYAVTYFQEPASADSIGGLLEFNYGSLDLETEQKSSGQITQTESDSWEQRYHLNMEKSIFPNLHLNAGGVFDKLETDSVTDGEDSDTTITNSRPYADLTLRTPLYMGGVGYSRREQEVKNLGFTGTTDINEQYSAILGWKPEGFPSFDMRLEKNNLFDKERLLRDTVQDIGFLNCVYVSKNLNLQYRPSYQDTNNRIDDLEIKTWNHNGRVGYSDTFHDGRTSFYTNYNISRQQTETISSGIGEVSTQLFPFSGLFVLDDTPSLGELNSDPALTDGNLTAGGAVNIGLPPPGGDTRPRNIGLDFVNDTEVNTFWVWVDKDLPASVVGSFSWDIYTSSDNLNWRLEATVFPAPFGPFQNFFEIDFPNVTARYIKAVVRPLSAVVPGAAGFPDIFVTELQAFLRRPADSLKGKITGTTQIFNTDVRSKLMDLPDLFYEFSYFLARSDPSSKERSTLSNGLALNHRFNTVFAGNARVAREDVDEEKGNGVSYLLNAALRADPLRTLSHTLLFSGRKETLGDESTDRASLLLQNNAELYKGIDTYLHGGLSRQTQGTGEKDDGTILNFGVTMIPSNALTLTMSFTSTTTDQSGGERPAGTLRDRREEIGAAYRPFQTLYLFASVGRVHQETRQDTLKNYSVNWTPFPYGALHLTFAYSEDLRTEDQSKERIIRPGLRWEITRRILLDLSYQILDRDSILETVNMNSFNANLRVIY